MNAMKELGNGEKIYQVGNGVYKDLDILEKDNVCQEEMEIIL